MAQAQNNNWKDNTISLATTQHTFTDTRGQVYQIYYAGFNLTKNLCSDDVAFVKIECNGKTYTNLSRIDDQKYARIDSILGSQETWRRCKDVPSTSGRVCRTEILDISINCGGMMIWTVVDEASSADHSPVTRKFVFVEELPCGECECGT